jgi:sugar phosphate isomerase/epimerase
MAVERTPRRLSVSTWSLHRTLGDPPAYGPGQPVPSASNGHGLALLELPAELAGVGLYTLEICHFHLPSRAPAYLDELRSALEDAGIELFSLLVDAGDITEAVHGAGDEAWIGEWIPVAAALGAQRMRVIAGKTAPDKDVLARSAAGLRRLAASAADEGVRLMTENWLQTTSRADAVVTLMEALEGQVGLCADFGNWRGPDKYEQLAAILPYAESCHAKCQFGADGSMDTQDYTRSLELADAAGFSGPYTLIYDGPDADEWAGLAREREVVWPYLRG